MRKRVWKTYGVARDHWRDLLLGRSIVDFAGRGVLNLIDIGSAGQLPDPWRFNADKIRLLMSFEPRGHARARRSVISVDCALAGETGERDFHVYAGFGGTGSSLYPQNYEYVRENYESLRTLGKARLAETWFERSKLVRTERILCRRLDEVIAERAPGIPFHFVKIDAQGAELEILRGAEKLLTSSCLGLQLELFELPLYRGIPLMPEVADHLSSRGFDLVHRYPPHGSFDSQRDCVFLKRGAEGPVADALREVYGLGAPQGGGSARGRIRPAAGDEGRPGIAVVMPTFSRAPEALSLAEALAGQGIPAASIFIVDHAPEPTVDPAAARALGVTIVRGSPSMWWSAAVNLGITEALSCAAPAGSILLVNDDLQIGPGHVDALRAAAAADPRAIVGSACIDRRTGRVRYADIRLDRLRAEFASRYRDLLPEALPAGASLDCDVLSCRGTLFPADAFRDVGLFDERRLPHYSADYEFSWRARRAGYRLVCAADARVETDFPRRGAARGDPLGYFLDRRRPGNLPATYEFARSCFGGPYALWFTTLTGARLLAGFVLESRDPR